VSAAASTPSAAAAPARRLVGKTRGGDRALLTLSAAGAAIILLMLVVIVGDVVIGGARTLSWEFVSQPPRDGMTAGGVFPAIFGTVVMTLLMTVVAVPAGVATAIYLTEFASAKAPLARLIRVCVANLAGVPSIVFGLFGLGFFISTVGKGIDAVAFGGQATYAKPCLIWSSLTLAILTLPVVVVATEEAILSVPRELREASYAVGATRMQTIQRVVLPEALGGILTGTILAVSRGAGEVAPILFTGVAYYLPYLPTNLNDQFMSLGYHVYVLATQSPDVDKTKPQLYGTALVLLLLTFLLNMIAISIRTRSRKRSRASA
jgi:phosphate transport system permease protein